MDKGQNADQLGGAAIGQYDTSKQHDTAVQQDLPAATTSRQ